MNVSVDQLTVNVDCKYIYDIEWRATPRGVVVRSNLRHVISQVISYLLSNFGDQFADSGQRGEPDLESAISSRRLEPDTHILMSDNAPTHRTRLMPFLQTQEHDLIDGGPTTCRDDAFICGYVFIRDRAQDSIGVAIIVSSTLYQWYITCARSYHQVNNHVIADSTFALRVEVVKVESALM